MSRIVGFKGSKEDLRKRIVESYWSCGNVNLNTTYDGWPDIKQYVDQRLRVLTEQIAQSIIDELYDNDNFEKDIGLK